MTGTNGKENFLFPLEVMWITQGSYTATATHDGTYAMDFQGGEENSSGNIVREYQAPCYAPVSCHCIEIYGSSAPAVLWESDDEVNFIDGTTGYACIGFTHENNTFSLHYVGETKNQGDIISHTGTMGGVGDHVHIEAKKGQGRTSGSNYYKNSYGWYMLRGSTWLYNLMGVNDTILHKTWYRNHNGVRVNYPWREFSDSPIPPEPVPPPYHGLDRRFPWVLYAKKLRTRQ